MHASAVRPDVSELMFRVYSRSVHPELFRHYSIGRILREEYTAQVCICEAGHLIEFRYRGETATEVTAARDHLLPTKNRLVERKLKGCRDESVRFPQGVHYQTSFQLEQLEPEVFQRVHEELSMDTFRVELSHEFPASSRWGTEALSLIHLEAEPRSLLVHTFHTFPDTPAVVKTQSLFEI